jgi:hypothetical protein
MIRDEVEDSILGDLLRLGTRGQNDETTPEQQASIRAMLPFMSLYIYCSPCVCLIHTAVSVCRKLQSPYLKVQLRPDSRLVSTCCSSVDRSSGMRSISEWIRDYEAQSKGYTTSDLATYTDTVWLDQRLEHLDYERPYNHKEPSNCRVRYLILGEADHISHMVQEAPGRIPRVLDIWHFKPDYLNVNRIFLSRFIEHQPEAKNHAKLFPQPLGLRRPVSPSSSTSASRGRKFGTESPGIHGELEDEEGTRSEAEEVELEA